MKKYARTLLSMLAAGFVLSAGEGRAAEPICPSSVGKGAAVWCTGGLAGSQVSIARNGNTLTGPAPAAYRICLDRRLGPGTLVTVYGETIKSLTDTAPCGCFRGSQLQVQDASGPPSLPPQKGYGLGGTYQAFAAPSCEKDAPLLKPGKARQTVAPCGQPDATGKDCTVALKDLGPGRAARLCLSPGYVVNPNNTGNISMRLNGYVPPVQDYNPLDALISATCFDVFDARSVTFRLGLWGLSTPDPNTEVRFTVAPLRR